jgi:hypothetical protein
MSRYLSKLAARSAGSFMPASMTPGPAGIASKETPKDPFQEVPAPSAEALPLSTPASAPSIEPAIPPAPSPIVPAPRVHVVQKEHDAIPRSEEKNLPVPTAPPPVTVKTVVEREKNIPAAAPKAPQSTVKVKPKEKESEPGVEPAKSLPSPHPHSTAIVVERRLAAREHGPTARELRPKEKPREEAAQREILPAPVPRESTQVLAPTPVESSKPEPAEPAQPRLVIGRMRVDVMPAPAPAAPQVVQVVQQRPASGRAVSASAPLRFGLGQM